MNNKTMEKYKSKYTEHIMGAPAWSVVDNKGNVMAVFKTTAELDGEDKAKQLADEMNREVVLADVKKWKDEIERAQRIVNNLAVALANMKSMITLKKKDLPGKFDPTGEYTHLKSRITIECE